MIKAIIVEDERLIREGIQAQVPWKELEVDEVRTAENAEAALAVCAEYRPDLIVSDIRMPGMDGITLCTKLRELLPDAQIVFISGYSDKEYLMSAIGLHAVNYIEKPVSLDDLKDAVRASVAALEKNRSGKKNALHALLNSPGTASARSGLVNESSRPYGAFFVAVLKSRSVPGRTDDEIQADCSMVMRKLSECGVQYMTDFGSDRKTAVLFYAEDVPALDALYCSGGYWKSLSECTGGSGGEFIGIGIRVTAAAAVRQSYETAVEALKCLSFKGWNCFAFSGEACVEWNELLPPETSAGFKKALADRREQRALSILSSVYSLLVESNALMTYSVRSLYYALDEAVGKAYHFDREAQEEGNRIKEYAETIRELHEYLCGRVRIALSGEDVQKNCFVVNRIISYVEKHYADKLLSVQSVADAVFLTPTYISCLFKKKTGKTIGQYIQDYRMEKAAEFLKDPQYKIYQISDMVGYEDAHYFTKLFKKQTGLKPSDFRDQTL